MKKITKELLGIVGGICASVATAGAGLVGTIMATCMFKSPIMQCGAAASGTVGTILLTRYNYECGKSVVEEYTNNYVILDPIEAEVTVEEATVE